MLRRQSSLLIPCHNAAAFLPRLWETVRSQTVPFDEVICYDDASSDVTVAVAKALGATVISGEKNSGPAFARNRLWQAASGEWVHFHDPDDLLASKFHERMASQATDAVDVAVCNAAWLREDTRELELEWIYSNAALQENPAAYLVAHPVGGINGYYRRSILTSVGGFDERLRIWEDADLHVRLAIAGARFVVVEESLVTALRRSMSISQDYLENSQCRLSLLERYAVSPRDESFRETLAEESEKTAVKLMQLGDTSGARRAVRLCQQLGRDVPTTQDPFLRACRRFLPALTLLRLQHFHRQNQYWPGAE